MQKYFNAVANAATGLPVPNASVQVLLLSTGLPAVIYADNGVTPKVNPVTTDAQGYFEFYAADGRYSMIITGAGIPTVTITDLILEDPASAGFTSGTMSGVTINACPIGGTTPSAAVFTTLTVNGVGNFADTISTGLGVTTGDAALELGAQRTGNGPAYLDLHGGVGTNFQARFIRLGGADGAASLINTGLGALNIQQGAAAPIVFQTSNTERARINTNGRFETIADSNAHNFAARARAADDFSQILFTNNAGSTLRGVVTVDSSNNFTFSTNSSAQNQFAIVNTAGSIRTVNVTGANGSNNPTISASAGALGLGGSGGSLAFFGVATGGTRPTISGSRSGATVSVLTSLLSSLNTLGLINDTTTA